MDGKKEDILERRSKLSLVKQALLEKRLRGEVKSDSQLEVIPRRSNTGTVPLSFTQQRLWFLHQLEESSSAFYSEPTFLQMLGSLNVVALEQSLNEIVRRHESLRTTFETVEGQPIQVIAPGLTLTLPVVNLCHLPETEQQAQVQRLAIEEIQQPFNLEHAPLLRVKLLQLNDQEHLLLFIIHHIVSDGWSLRVLIRELADIYQAFCAGKPSPLPELPIQYADFAVWQHQWLQGEVLKKHLSYWKQQLAGAPPILELPTDRPRPPVQSFRGATITFKLSPELTSRLKSLSQKQGVTLFITLLAAFQTLLYRYSGQEDICVGSPIANRNRKETHGLIGCFVNTIVMRTDLSDNPSFLKLLKRVQQVAQGAYAHEDLPFKRVVEELQLERNLSYQPLFQVMFVLQNSTKEDLVLPGLSLKQLLIDTGTAKFDFGLYIEDAEPELIGWWEYNTDLFDTVTITRMLEHFQILLEGIVANPQEHLAQLPLLSVAGKHQLLVEWNNTQAEYPQDQCFAQLFEAQVARTPNAVAVVFENQQLTYAQLNSRANRWARQLVDLGVKAETIVALVCDRNIDFLTAMLAVFKAGGAYLPMNPHHPVERWRQVLEQIQVTVVLTAREFEPSVYQALAHQQQKSVVLLIEQIVAQQYSEQNLPKRCQPENLAYVIFTSGSTGKPKGAMLEHQGMLNHLFAKLQDLHLSASDVVAQTASQSFDISIWQFLVALLVGGQVEIINSEIAANPTQLLTLVETQKISILEIVPSLLRMMLQQLELDSATMELSQLRWLLLTGEALAPQLCRQWLEHYPTIPLLNAYGPTECSDDVTHYPICVPPPPEMLNLPIGRPVSNTQLYVLDRQLQPVPIGVTGELYVGGVGVGRGYVNNPQQTQQVFLPDPFAQKPGCRLYKTGDLARYLSNGEIEYIGRIDHQVKVRGFRIELGEIEALLSKHPAVQEVIVLAREDQPGDKRLVAYIVSKQEQAPTNSDLHGFVKAKLPEYMVPSAFVLLKSLPLTPNGKLDRRALPTPDTARPELETVYTAPRTAAEEVLVKVWAQVLGLKQVGIYDNFFEVGGDSILSIQAIARARQAGLQLTPKQMFEHQTIAELAPIADTTLVIRAEQGSITGSVPLTPIQRWFFEEKFSDQHHWNQAVMLEVRQAINETLLESALQQLFVHYDTLRLRYLQKNSDWEQVYASSNELVSFTRLDLSALSPELQAAAIEATNEQLQSSLNLSEGPLMWVALYHLHPQKPSLMLMFIHHLIIDGVSWRILLEALHTAYQQLSQGEEIKLPLKTTSFKRWAQRLQEYAPSKELRQEQPYWLAPSRKHISPLPIDKPKGDNTVASSRIVSVALSAEETQALLHQAPQVYRTQINDLLLTAVVQAFAQWTGERKLLIDLEGHGREDIFEDVDLSLTVGWFTTIFPTVLDIGEARHPEEALKSIKEQLRQIPNQGLGYGVLRYMNQDTEIVNQLRSLPQADILFNYLGQLDRIIPEDSMFKLSQSIPGLSRSLKGNMPRLFECNVFIMGGRLQLDLAYSKNMYQDTTIQSLAQSFLETLQSLIAYCQSPEAGGFTPSDFPDVELSQEKLDKALAEIDFS
ncbi:MAG: amino acid adenylation domain-containing protein [Rhizonema sp. PD37]|nr:amino acid adenylation domain-containing protein [Rhizonema sp. PD37]